MGYCDHISSICINTISGRPSVSACLHWVFFIHVFDNCPDKLVLLVLVLSNSLPGGLVG